jgi:putative ABC transport system permease protein
LALAIGASAAAFSVVDAIRFRALPFADADRLVLIAEVPDLRQRPGTSTGAGCRAACDVAFTTYQQVLRTRSFQTLTAITAHASGIKALTIRGEVEPVLGTVASQNLFSVLRAAPIRGRVFSTDDDQLGAPPVTVLSHELWSTRFGADPAIIGTRVQLSDTRYTVVGIMPPNFDFESGSRFWLPAIPNLDPSTRPSIRSVTIIGHLAAGATVEQARAELAGVDPGALEGGTAAGSPRVQLTALPLRDRYSAATQHHDVIFFGVVLCVMLIACANLTNLLFARTLDQRREFVVRAALGAEPWRLARHVLAEQVILTTARAALGVAFAKAFLAAIRSLPTLDTFRPSGMDYRVDARVVAFAFAVAIVAAFVASFAPIRLVLGSKAHDALRENPSSASSGVGSTRTQGIFAIAQMAFAVTLLIAAGLVAKTAWHLSRVELGFKADRLMQATPSLPHDWRVKEKYLPVIAQIQLALPNVPGVAALGTRATVVLGSARTPAEMTLVGRGAALPRADVPPSALAIDSGYFSAVGVPIVRGRNFTSQDVEESTPVAIVNEWAAAHWWAGRDPIGTQLRIDTLPGRGTVVTIVGVVRDNKAAKGNLLLAVDGPELYRPLLQLPSAFPSFFIRFTGGAASVTRPIRTKLSEIVPNRPLSSVVVASAVERQLRGARTTALQILSFAAIGLVLAIVGVGGVLSFNVNRRLREIGIRRALGATAAGVWSLILRDAARLTLSGILIGIAGALVVCRSMTSLLTGTTPNDPLTYVVVSLAVMLTALIAAALPGRRASRVLPLTAIRESRL